MSSKVALTVEFTGQHASRMARFVMKKGYLPTHSRKKDKPTEPAHEMVTSDLHAMRYEKSYGPYVRDRKVKASHSSEYLPGASPACSAIYHHAQFATHCSLFDHDYLILRQQVCST